MPELPEVTTVCNILKENITDKYIDNAIIYNHKLRVDIDSNLINIVKNKKIINIYRKAKYIIIDIEKNYSIIIHLGMSGKFIIINKANNYKIQKHDHCIFKLHDESLLVYNDPRRFGLIAWENSNQINNNNLFKHLGVEPLTNDFNLKYFKDKIKNRTAPIKNIIMNNNIIVGVGNIYACESLFLSKISPLKPANQCNDKELLKLISNIKLVLENAIKAGGSSLKDYKNANNQSGYFQNQLYVYGLENKNCQICNNIIKSCKQGGRTSFFCPNCQKN